MNRPVKILAAALIGAFIGSSMGIAALGDAIAATVPMALLMAYLTYLWTKPTQSQTIQEPVNSTAATEQDPLKVLEKTVHDAMPLMIRFLGASWNLLMKLFIAIGIMPIVRKTPWLMIVLIIIIMAIILPVGIFFCIAGFVATDRGAKPDNNFMMPL